VIRRLSAGDAEELTTLLVANRARLQPLEPDRPDDFYTVAFQRDRLANIPDGRWLFGIVDGDALAGTIGVNNTIRGPLQSANIGYWIDEPRQGRGLATAAVGDVVRFAFDEADLHRVEAGTLPENFASQRVLEKNGFERIGLARRYLLIGGDWRDHILFQRVKDG
jgi:[ribosomal protein S5]-alanine N-acetyltransferase